jgi:hypothetical protein
MVLQETRALVLREGGYETTEVIELDETLETALRTRAEIAILGHSIPPEEQVAMAGRLHGEMPELVVICLRAGITDPARLLKACEAAGGGAPEPGRIRLLEDGTGISRRR